MNDEIYPNSTACDWCSLQLQWSQGPVPGPSTPSEPPLPNWHSPFPKLQEQMSAINDTRCRMYKRERKPQSQHFLREASYSVQHPTYTFPKALLTTALQVGSEIPNALLKNPRGFLTWLRSHLYNTVRPKESAFQVKIFQWFKMASNLCPTCCCHNLSRVPFLLPDFLWFTLNMDWLAALWKKVKVIQP